MLQPIASEPVDPPSVPERGLVLGIICQAINDVRRNVDNERCQAMKWIFESRGERSLKWWCDLIGDDDLPDRVRARATQLVKAQTAERWVRYRRNSQ